jgi:hypothetical protein
MRRTIALLMLACALWAQESPFKEADEAYAQGKLRSAEKLYSAIAIATPDPQVQADAFLRLAWVQFSLNEKQAALYSLEKALTLNPKLTVDPNIYNQEFYRLFEMASLRRTLASSSPGDDPLGERAVPIPGLFVPAREEALPSPPVKMLSLPATTPFAVPLDNKILPAAQKAPGAIAMEGDITLAVLVDALGKPRQARVYQSDFPQFGDTIVRQALAWKFTPAAKTGRPVATWTAVVLRLKSKYKWDIQSAKFTPAAQDDPIPVFLPWGFQRDRIPGEYQTAVFKDAENIHAVDAMPDLRKADVDLDDFSGRETIKGVVWIGPDGRVKKFRATQIHAPGLIPYLEQALTEGYAFTPPLSGGRPVEAWLNAEITVEYKLQAPKLLASKSVKVNLYAP